MGITHKEYFENIYELIFTPFEFFKRDDIVISVRQAAATIAWVSLFTIIGKAIADKSIYNNFFFWSNLLFFVGFIILAWLITGLFFEYIAKIFGREAGLHKILFYTSFAAVPYIFFAPLDILKESGEVGYAIGVLSQMFLYFWIITLYAFALKKTYNISIARAFMMIILPFIGTIFSIGWAIGFYLKLGYINSI